MAQTVMINGVTYNDVAEVRLPLASDISKLVVFPDTADATAVESDIKRGKTAYVNGKMITGSHSEPTISLTSGVLSIA